MDDPFRRRPRPRPRLLAEDARRCTRDGPDTQEVTA